MHFKLPELNQSLKLIPEPPCWGSGELPYLPPEWMPYLTVDVIQGLTRKSTKHPEITLGMLCSLNWATMLKSAEPKVDEEIQDLIFIAIAKRLSERPAFTESLIINRDLIGLAHLDFFPFRLETLRALSNAEISDKQSLRTLLNGSYLEAFLQIGDWKSVIDISITSRAWIAETATGNLFVQSPILPETLSDAFELARIRHCRMSGYDPTTDQYSLEFANVMGRRHGLSEEGKWTLAQCGTRLDLTRERIRQIEKTAPWEPSPRKWPTGTSLDQALCLFALETDSKLFEIEDVQGNPVQIDRQCFVMMCDFLGVILKNNYNSTSSFKGELRELGLSVVQVFRSIISVIGRTGFIVVTDLLAEIANLYPKITKEQIEFVVTQASRRYELPYNYMYLEDKRGCFFPKWIIKTLSLCGSLSIDELYAASIRECQHRCPGAIHPPRDVMVSFLDQDDRFIIEGNTVLVLDPIVPELGPTKMWMHNVITDQLGQVIHRTELMQAARENKVNRSTVAVYCSYSAFFKSVGRNCVSITGQYPSEEVIAHAYVRGAALRERTFVVGWRIDKDCIIVDINVGTDMADSGIITFRRDLMAALGFKKYRICVESEQFGHASLNNGIYLGWNTALSQLGAAPGETITARFNPHTESVEISLFDQAECSED